MRLYSTPESAKAGDITTLAVVIPALNERENLELLLPALRETLDGLGVPSEVIVVDGGSRDGTADAAERRGARVVVQRTPGFGAALRDGFAATTAGYVVTMDADLSHRPVFIEELWKRRAEADVLVASRYVPGGCADMGWLRRLLSRILNRVYRRALSLPLNDLSSNFRMYRRRVLAAVTCESRDFDVLEELLIEVHAAGWRIEEVPFRYMARGSGRSHARLVRFGWALLKTLVRLWRLRNSVRSADYDHRAFDSPIWPQRYWQRARHRIVLDAVKGRTAILDAGCGTSRIIQDLPGAVGLDVAEPKLRWLAHRRARLVGGTCERLPFRDETFDAVVNSEVIEHVPDTPDILREAWRVLRPGGILVLGTPDYGRVLWWVIEWIYGKVVPGGYAQEHVTRFTHAELSARLRQGGWHVLGCRYVGGCEMIFTAQKPSAAPPG
ncbi:MAG: glycosyltransferase [Candidatus Rokubacteria bacterium]|nr:glycosyltransferase [Candidatus Rokubacteria bacterium]